jgi:hypothetical protein
MDELQSLGLCEVEYRMKNRYNYLPQVGLDGKNHQSVVRLKIHMKDELRNQYLVVKKSLHYMVVVRMILLIELCESFLVEQMLQGVQYELASDGCRMKKNFVMKLLRQSAANKNGAGLTRLMMYLNSLFVVPCHADTKIGR